MRWVPDVLAMLLLEEAEDELTRYEKVTEGYESYTLFLIPSNYWITENQQKASDMLKKLFHEFGDAIGADHDAVYFIDPDNEKNEADVNRSKWYCDKYGLDYVHGPYLVYTEEYPDLAKADEVIVTQFNNIDSNRIVMYIQELAKSIRTGKKPKKTSKIDYVYEKSRSVISNNRDIFKELLLRGANKLLPI